jgi:prepilin-type N-terminal cleavage/methylation domain-containing protein
MLPQTRRRRAAFTLIELLVVMAIIAIIVSLTTAAVQRVRALGQVTENSTRMAQLNDAIGRFKDGLGVKYLPSQRADGAGFRLKRSYADTDPELDFLLQCFPNMDRADNGYTGGDVTLDQNQLLCFFLTGGVATNYSGFSFNPKQPFAAGGGQRKGPYYVASPKLVTVAPNGQAWLVDAYGVPYAFFASGKGQANNYGTPSFSPGGTAGTVRPYKTSNSPLRFVNESGFQIISAGKDKTFGPGDANLPATGAGEDDQAQFSKAVLGAGIN